MKLGLQWAPIKQVRVGWIVATPSYLVYLDNEATATQSLSPPNAPPQFQGTQIDEIGGAWAGVETGVTRLGIATLGKWGWVEADMVLSFPLETPELGIDRKTVANARLGGIFGLTERLKLGAGFFTAGFLAPPLAAGFDAAFLVTAFAAFFVPLVAVFFEDFGAVFLAAIARG